MENEGNCKNSAAGIDAEYNAELAYCEHQIAYVKPLAEYKLKVVFAEGVEVCIDLQELIDTNEHFAALRDNKTLFDTVQAQSGGLVWTDDLDLSNWYVWDNGTIISTAFDKLIGMREATDAWGLNESTVRKAIENGRLQEGIDYKKMGGMHVLTRASMERLFGPAIADIHPEELCYPDEVMRRYNRYMDKNK